MQIKKMAEQQQNLLENQNGLQEKLYNLERKAYSYIKAYLNRQTIDELFEIPKNYRLTRTIIHHGEKKNVHIEAVYICPYLKQVVVICRNAELKDAAKIELQLSDYLSETPWLWDCIASVQYGRDFKTASNVTHKLQENIAGFAALLWGNKVWLARFEELNPDTGWIERINISIEWAKEFQETHENFEFALAGDWYDMLDEFLLEKLKLPLETAWI